MSRSEGDQKVFMKFCVQEMLQKYWRGSGVIKIVV